jgi:hypothetical protein
MVSKILAYKHIKAILKENNKENKQEKQEKQEKDDKKTPMTLTFPSRGNKFELSFIKHSHYLEIDVDTFVQSTDKLILCDFIKHVICDQYNVQKKPQILLIHNIQRLHEKSLIALSKVLEKSPSVYFVFPCSETCFHIYQKLSAFCLITQCNLDNKNILIHFIKHLEENQFKTCYPSFNSNDFIMKSNMILKRASHDIINAIILLQLPKPYIYQGYLTPLIENFIKNSHINNKNNIMHFEKDTKNLCAKLSSTCIPIPEITKIIIQYTNTNHPQHIYDIIRMSANVDHQCKLSHKQSFALELYFYEVVNLLNTK